MTRVLLTLRLAGRDVRHRAIETLLLLVALAIAATTLTIGVVLHGQTAAPYAETKAITAGPDVTAVLLPPPGRTLSPKDLSTFQAVAQQPAVRAHSPAFPVSWTPITVGDLHGVAEVVGRDTVASAVDKPHLLSGTWVSPDGVVVERAFAQALGLRVGDAVELDDHQVTVAGIAVSTALPPFPQLCTIGCILDRPGWISAEPGLVWASRARTTALATQDEPLAWFTYFTLHNPAQAQEFAAANSAGPLDLEAWQGIASLQDEQLGNQRTAVIFGSSLMVILALATLVVLVGGRMADEARRVGTLKAAGATPGFIARLLLVSYLAIGAVAALVGLLAGRLLAPHLVSLSAGLLGRSGPTSVSVTDALLVVAATLGIVVIATVVPAVRASRISTVRALADAGRMPHRSRLLVGVSAAMPAPVLLGIRLMSRRPRRTVLTALSIAVASCGLVVVLYVRATQQSFGGGVGTPIDPQAEQLRAVMTTVTALLVVMAAVNLVFVTRASAIDARRTLALARTLGASPAEVAVSLGVAQLLPAVLGLIGGGVGGIVLFRGLSPNPVTPPMIELVGLLPVTVLTVVLLTALPARLEAMRPVAATLREQ